MSALIRFGFPLMQGAPGLGNLQNLRRIWVPKPVADTKLAKLEFPTDPRSVTSPSREAKESKMPPGFEETYRKEEAKTMDKEGSGGATKLSSSFEDLLPEQNKVKVKKSTLDEMMDEYFESKMASFRNKKGRAKNKGKKRKYVLVTDSEEEDDDGDDEGSKIYKKFKTFSA